jgi:tetratricopeptide (TPR) repeat protein
VDPNNEPAHESMGLLHYREGDIDGAMKWYGEAVALNSNSYAALFNFASMGLRAGGSEENAAIESSLRTAIRINPQFAPAYDALAMYLASRHRDLEEARILTLRAIQLEPDRLSFHLNRAEVLTQARQYANAIGLLNAARRLARTPDEIATVESRIERIADYEARPTGTFTRAN